MTTPPSVFTSFPPETVEQIVENVFLSPPIYPWRAHNPKRELACLLKVAPCFRYPVVKLLFREIALTYHHLEATQPRISLLHDIINNNATILKCISKLSLTFDQSQTKVTKTKASPRATDPHAKEALDSSSDMDTKRSINLEQLAGLLTSIAASATQLKSVELKGVGRERGQGVLLQDLGSVDKVNSALESLRYVTSLESFSLVSLGDFRAQLVTGIPKGDKVQLLTYNRCYPPTVDYVEDAKELENLPSHIRRLHDPTIHDAPFANLKYLVIRYPASFPWYLCGPYKASQYKEKRPALPQDDPIYYAGLSFPRLRALIVGSPRNETTEALERIDSVALVNFSRHAPELIKVDIADSFAERYGAPDPEFDEVLQKHHLVKLRLTTRVSTKSNFTGQLPRLASFLARNMDLMTITDLKLTIRFACELWSEARTIFVGNAHQVWVDFAKTLRQARTLEYLDVVILLDLEKLPYTSLPIQVAQYHDYDAVLEGVCSESVWSAAFTVGMLFAPEPGCNTQVEYMFKLDEENFFTFAPGDTDPSWTYHDFRRAVRG